MHASQTQPRRTAVTSARSAHGTSRSDLDSSSCTRAARFDVEAAALAGSELQEASDTLSHVCAGAAGLVHVLVLSVRLPASSLVGSPTFCSARVMDAMISIVLSCISQGCETIGPILHLQHRPFGRRLTALVRSRSLVLAFQTSLCTMSHTSIMLCSSFPFPSHKGCGSHGSAARVRKPAPLQLDLSGCSLRQRGHVFWPQRQGIGEW
jgi:hypothetical protein